GRGVLGITLGEQASPRWAWGRRRQAAGCNPLRGPLYSRTVPFLSSGPVRAPPMSSAGTVTGWIAGLQSGDAEAAQRLWERSFARLVRLVRTKLRDTSRCAADEEDVALSAFDSFCRRAEQGRFPRLCDREDLWRLLVLIAERKAIKLREHEQAAKRG